MRLNTLKPAPGAKRNKQIVGRGIGSGTGKTCKRGHKGQRSRRGAPRAFIGFEGGQIPLQRRLPKSGFTSRKQSTTTQLTLSELSSVASDEIDMKTLLTAGLIGPLIKRVKIILSGEVTRALTVKSSIAFTKGAKAALEEAGGKIELESKEAISEETAKED